MYATSIHPRILDPYPGRPDPSRLIALGASGYHGPAYLNGRPAYEYASDLIRARARAANRQRRVA
jgi:hypothetical protein